MEGDVLEAARKLYDRAAAQVLTFHLNESEMVQGLICGGNLDVLIEPLTRAHIPLLRRLKDIRDKGEDSVIATLIADEHSVCKKLLNSPGNTEGLRDQWHEILRQEGDLRATHHSAEELVEETQKAHHRHSSRRLAAGDGELILEPMQGRPHLMIFGGGHVSRSISRMAALAGFRVTVIDDRKEYANPERFPEADTTLAVEFHEAFQHLTVTPSTYLVIVTRGHRSDEKILEQALKTPARYVGMIGSRKKVLTTYEHLLQQGTPIEALRQVHAPMGFEIGAVTAEEIGVSIVAELIHRRRNGADPVVHMSRRMNGLLHDAAGKKE